MSRKSDSQQSEKQVRQERTRRHGEKKKKRRGKGEAMTRGEVGGKPEKMNSTHINNRKERGKGQLQGDPKTEKKITRVAGGKSDPHEALNPQKTRRKGCERKESGRPRKKE